MLNVRVVPYTHIGACALLFIMPIVRDSHQGLVNLSDGPFHLLP